jgi:hypothetical protein
MHTTEQIGALNAVFQSKWGYHPCSYDDFLLIKEFHWLVYLDFQATKKLDRWNARIPHNRRGKKPDSSLGTSKKYYQGVLFGYRVVRFPAPTPEKVQPIPLAPLQKTSGVYFTIQPKFPVDWRDQINKYREIYGRGDVGILRGPINQTNI